MRFHFGFPFLLSMALGAARGGLGGRKPPGKGLSQPGCGHTATGVSMREKFNKKIQDMVAHGRPQVSFKSAVSRARF
jgi:hypothetical protein